MSDIQKAIEILSDFSKQILVKADGAYEKNDFIEAKKMAISVLQEQAEREKGCEMCNSGILMVYDSFLGTDGENVNFCPNCGRDLRKPVNQNE